ncbi:MAG TPA: ABC transporter ATP-binding protein [Acidimicrobiia bacterium]|nr:ABC transporter ATP-binding protein [Acidimicrobiia bacterium]
MIQVDELRFRYPGTSDDVLASLSFSIGAGSVFGFLGPSGAGKSTTQRILTGVLDGWSGSVSVDGRPLAELGADYRARIGVSFEFPNVYTRLTARENLAFFASLHRGETRDPLELLGLVGLADVADQRVGTFSKGMRMRLNLARAFLNRPSLLFLDEPTSGLDPSSARFVKDLVRSAAADGAAVFVTTHDMATATEVCDVVGFLLDGRLAGMGTPRDLMVAHGRRTVRVGHREDSGALAVEEFGLDQLGRHERFLELVTGGRIETIHTTEATLEDVFLAVTGRQLT